MQSPDRVVQLTGDTDFVRSIEIDLVLQNLLNDDLHFVARIRFNQRSAAGVEGDQPFLNQRRELKTSANLVDDFLFLQCIDHSLLSPCC